MTATQLAIRSMQSLPRRPGETAPGQNVCVNMVDRLTAIATGVEHDPEAVGVCGTDFCRNGHDFSGKRRIRAREFCDVVVVCTRNNQHVCRRLRIDVVERNHPIGRVHERRRDVASGNTAEQAVHDQIVFRSGPTRRAGEHDSSGYRTGGRRSQDGRSEPDRFGAGFGKLRELLRGHAPLRTDDQHDVTGHRHRLS